MEAKRRSKPKGAPRSTAKLPRKKSPIKASTRERLERVEKGVKRGGLGGGKFSGTRSKELAELSSKRKQQGSVNERDKEAVRSGRRGAKNMLQRAKSIFVPPAQRPKDTQEGTRERAKKQMAGTLASKGKKSGRTKSK